jgi:hypothetical protein
MKKEVIIAILIGLALGLIVTYGIYRARMVLVTQHSSNIASTSATPSSSSAHNSLSLISPEDESIQSNKDIKVTGTTDPNAIVVIFLNDTPIVTNADSSGSFSVSADLAQGSNIILVRTIDEDGNSVEEQRTVIYTTASLEEAPTASNSANTATSSAKPKSTIKSSTGTASPTPSPAVKK